MAMALASPSSVSGLRNVLYAPGMADLAVLVVILAGVVNPMTFPVCALWFYLSLSPENSGVSGHSGVR